MSENKAQAVQKTSALANAESVKKPPFMQCLHVQKVPWAAQHIPQTPITIAENLSSCVSSYCRTNAGGLERKQ